MRFRVQEILPEPISIPKATSELLEDNFEVREIEPEIINY